MPWSANGAGNEPAKANMFSRTQSAPVEISGTKNNSSAQGNAVQTQSRQTDAPSSSRALATEILWSSSPTSSVTESPRTVPGDQKFRTIRIIGGMGQKATWDLMGKITDYCQKEKDLLTDQQLPPIEVKCPVIPDRTNYLRDFVEPLSNPLEQLDALKSARIENPLVSLEKAFDEFQKSGPGVIAMSCNTAHAWFDLLNQRKRTEVEFVHIAFGVISALEKRLVKLQRNDPIKIGLLATSGTVKNRIYQKYIERLGLQNLIKVVVPDEVTQAKVTSGIYDGVKAGDIDEGRKLLREAADTLIDEHSVDALLLACTEIPIVITDKNYKSANDTQVNSKGVVVIDATAALAEACVEAADNENPAYSNLKRRMDVMRAAPAAIPAKTVASDKKSYSQVLLAKPNKPNPIRKHKNP